MYGSKKGRRKNEKLFLVVERASLLSSSLNMHDLRPKNQITGTETTCPKKQVQSCCRRGTDVVA